MQLTMFHGMPRQQLLLLLGLAATGGMDAARVRGDSSLNAGANMKPAMTVKGQHNSAVHNSLAKLLDEGLKSPGGGDGDDAAALLIHELMSKSGGSSSPQSMEDMIPQLLPILQGMENSTKRQHAAAQNHINSVHGHFELCHPSSNSSLSTYWSTYQSTLSSHTTCRGSEFTLENGYTSCTVRKSNLKTEMDDKKTLYDDVNGDPTPTPDCQSPTSEGRGDYLLRLKNFFNSTYTEWSTRKQNWVTAKTAYEQVTCNNEQTSFTNKKAECDRDLRTIESNACSYAQGVKTACDSYDTCWTDAEAAYNEAKQATQEQEAAFKVHWRGVQRMKCVLKALGNGSATTADASVLEACIGVTLYDTSHLDVTYPAVPAKDSCDDPTEYPCSAAYVTAVYQSLQPNTPPNVPVCNACVLPGLQASNTFTYDETAGVKTEGWSSALTTNTGDGLVHGPFAGNTVLTKTFTLPDHESVTLTLRYWSLDSWDMEKGYVKVDGAEVWSKVRESCLDCVGWQSFGGQFPNPWLNDNQKCYEDVEIVRPHSATQLTLTIGSNTDQDAKDEAWAVDRITLVVQATVAVTPTVQVCPEGYEQLGKIGDDVPGWGMSTGGNTASDVYRCAAQCTANDACGAFEFKEDFPNACALNSFADASTQAQTGTWTGALTCKKVLGPRANECWDACGARRGYCDKCPSAGGKRGACCMNGDENDPAECQRVPRSDFPHAGYHECVLVPEGDDFRAGFEPLDTEFVIDGLPAAGVMLPDGVTNRACVQNGGSSKPFDDSGPIGCNKRCVSERESGAGCWAIQHDLPPRGSNRRREGTCRIFTRPVLRTVARQGSTCMRLGSGGDFPKAPAATCRKKSTETDTKTTPHELMTTRCPRPVLKTQCMTAQQYENIVARVKRAANSLNERCDAASCEQADWFGCVLRMAGHDFMDFEPSETEGKSGSNACTDMTHPDNTGLKTCLVDGEHGVSLKKIYEEFCTTVSLADFLVIAAEAVMVVSREHVLLEDDPNAPTLDFKSQFRFGRRTAKSCVGAANHLPDPEDGCTAVSETFIEHMGLTPRRAAALMGVHTLGRARPENSGYDGWWSDPLNSHKFNNNYFVSLVRKGWRPMRAVCGNRRKNQWYKSGPGGVHQGPALEMMLDTDICLAFSNGNPEKVNVTKTPGVPVKASRDKCCAWLIRHPITKKPLGTFNEICGLHNVHDCGSIFTNKGFGLAGDDIFEFSENEKAWLDTFLLAWNQATENGFSRLTKLKQSCR